MALSPHLYSSERLVRVQPLRLYIVRPEQASAFRVAWRQDLVPSSFST
jgi:hypothetical protein